MENNKMLELEMQELETLDAPGWWSSFVDSVVVTGVTVAAYT